ncbi:hypothetical protein BN844_1831 [Pseudomonas sp. SHC52]|nr:hypothetical protein BN844_1831 [Pseudomonas sp. SHC52]
MARWNRVLPRQFCAHGRALLKEPVHDTCFELCAKVMFEYM